MISRWFEVGRERPQHFQKLGITQGLRYYMSSSGRPIELNIEGDDYWVRPRTPDLKVLLESRSGELESVRWLLPIDFCGVIVDAGGYIGTSALALARMFPHAQIVTIEPSIENFAVLRRNVAEWSNIRVVAGALAATDDRVATLRSRGTDQWGYTCVENPSDCRDPLDIEEVQCYSLSGLDICVENVGLIKLDIKGYEKELFEGSGNLLDKAQVILVELHDRIVPGCSESFLSFSADRVVVKTAGEKFLSISRRKQPSVNVPGRDRRGSSLSVLGT